MKEIRVFVIVAIFSGCSPELLDDDGYIDKVLRSAAKKSHLTLLYTSIRKFQPQGVTGIAVIGESHIAVHSWPQHGSFLVDIATCSTKESAAAAFKEITAHFPDGHIASYREFDMTNESSLENYRQ